jgi:hypothetical protein
MTFTVPQARRHHQRRIATLLDELEERRRRLYILQARGVRPAGLRDLKAELRAVREELAAVVAAAGSSPGNVRRDRPQATHRPRPSNAQPSYGPRFSGRAPVHVISGGS